MFLESEIKCWAVIQADEQKWIEEGRTGGINWIHHVLYVCEIWKVDFRDVNTIDYGITQGAEVLNKRCPCGLYMLRRLDQDYEYCWDCECSKALARRGRASLAIAKNLAMKKTNGIHIIEPDEPVKPEGQELRGPFAVGMPA